MITHHATLLVYCPNAFERLAVVADWAIRPDPQFERGGPRDMCLSEMTGGQVPDPIECGMFIWEGTVSPAGSYDHRDEVIWEGQMRALEDADWDRLRAGLFFTAAG